MNKSDIIKAAELASMYENRQTTAEPLGERETRQALIAAAELLKRVEVIATTQSGGSVKYIVEATAMRLQAQQTLAEIKGGE